MQRRSASASASASACQRESPAGGGREGQRGRFRRRSCRSKSFLWAGESAAETDACTHAHVCMYVLFLFLLGGGGKAGGGQRYLLNIDDAVRSRELAYKRSTLKLYVSLISCFVCVGVQGAVFVSIAAAAYLQTRLRPSRTCHISRCVVTKSSPFSRLNSTGFLSPPPPPPAQEKPLLLLLLLLPLLLTRSSTLISTLFATTSSSSVRASLGRPLDVSGGTLSRVSGEPDMVRPSSECARFPWRLGSPWPQQCPAIGSPSRVSQPASQPVGRPLIEQRAFSSSFLTSLSSSHSRGRVGKDNTPMSTEPTA